MEKFPWDDDAISKPAHNATNELPRSLSARELVALGLPVDDPFWMSPEAFDAHLAEVEGLQAAQVKTLGPDAPAAQNIRVASPSRAPLPSLDPRKRGAAVAELPEAVRRAVEIIAKPHAPDDQAIGAAAYLLKWHQAEYRRRPTLKGMVSWWWKAARRLVDIRSLWADEIRLIWKTDECPYALDPASASVNAFYGVLAHHAARVFIAAQGHKPDDDAGRDLMRKAGFSTHEIPKGKSSRGSARQKRPSLRT
ncbi:hypothetical protein [Sagittula sp. MA-2]|jgi:hypothetical protein|uniref:hypothetical protein n=1 Tax=Sagittula sp. MA-2 TaxID=3048007 RepID=UPI0024C2627C|nr:hypothetical protein [Sagittula sp. MA-2]WHZ37338.1 hypothetical protein QNI11_10025 [Sagittula sp. MA-2]